MQAHRTARTSRPGHIHTGTVQVLEYTRQRHAYGALRRALKLQLGLERSDGLIDDWTARTLQLVPRAVYCEAAALAWTRCRWGELQTLDWGAAARGQRLYITQSKTGSHRRGPQPAGTLLPIWREVPATAKLPFRAYATCSTYIQIAADRAGVRLPARAKDGTHIFRHIFASTRAARGWNIEAIAAKLGHASTDSTRHYIHEIGHWRSPSNDQR